MDQKIVNVFIDKIENIKTNLPILIKNCTDEKYPIDFSYLMYNISKYQTTFGLLESIIVEDLFDDTNDNKLNFVRSSASTICNICSNLVSQWWDNLLKHKELKNYLEEIKEEIATILDNIDKFIKDNND